LIVRLYPSYQYSLRLDVPPLGLWSGTNLADRVIRVGLLLRLSGTHSFVTFEHRSYVMEISLSAAAPYQIESSPLQGRPVRALCDAQMHRGQTRGKR